LPTSVERVLIGFMGCHAAINALKVARHIVRSEPDARVLVLNLELCTLHLRDAHELEDMLGFLLFADGCAACLVTSEPQGIAIDRFRAVLVLEMVLAPRVPNMILRTLKAGANEILSQAPAGCIDLWAIHPGGASIVDAVQRALDLKPEALSYSRDVLRTYGNMSSATVMFVLASMMRPAPAGATGCAMSFGPGMVAETMTFRNVGRTG